MKLKTTTKFGAAALVALALTSAAQALPYINGDIQFIGAAQLNNAVLANATGVTSFGSVTSMFPTGSFATPGYLTNPTVFTSPWMFNTVAPGISPFWTAGSFTFDLTASSKLPSSTPTFLDVSGFGTVSAAGFAPTAGTWTFTISSASGSANNGNFSFQSSATSAGVPDGGATVALLGFSLLGLHGVRRKFATR